VPPPAKIGLKKLPIPICLYYFNIDNVTDISSVGSFLAKTSTLPEALIVFGKNSAAITKSIVELSGITSTLLVSVIFESK
jgi:hypothetical protein